MHPETLRDLKTPIFLDEDHVQNQYADDTDLDSPVSVNPDPISMITDPKHKGQNRVTISYHSIMLKIKDATDGRKYKSLLCFVL